MKTAQIIEDIKNKMPQGLSEIERLRYIYIYMGKIQNFDPVYYFGNSKVKSKIYRLTEKMSLNNKYYERKRELICTSIAANFKAIASEFGLNVIKAREQLDRHDRYSHAYNKVTLEDGQTLNVDLQLDLRYIQTGRRTRFFGKNEDDDLEIDEKFLEKIDENIGYKKRGKEYKDEEMKTISDDSKKMTTIEAINYILGKQEIIDTIEETGYVEGTKYLRDIFEMCNNDRKDKIRISIAHCYREIGLDEYEIPKRQYSICLHLKEKDDDKLYLYKKRDKKFTEVSTQRMSRLMNQGLKFSKRPEYNFDRFIRETGNWENIWTR